MIILYWCIVFVVWAIGVGVFVYVWDWEEAAKDEAHVWFMLAVCLWPILVWFWLGFMICKWNETKPIDYSEKLK